MATKKILLLFLYLLTTSIFAQLNWEQTKGPYGGRANDMVKDFKGNYYVATEAGLFVSEDNCEHWGKVNIPSFHSDGMREIFLHPSGRIFISGWNDYLYRSDENVTNWQASQLKRQINIDSHGNLFGTNQKIIYVSSNMGNTWKTQTTFKEYIKFFCLVNDSNMVIATDTVYYSNNLGKTWVKSDIPFYWDSGFILDKNKNIYFIQDYNLYKSSDYGKSWEIIKYYRNPYQPDFLSSIVYRVLVDKDNFIYMCSFGGLIVSYDNGISWVKLGSLPYPVNKLYEDDKGNIFCLGGNDGVYRYDTINKAMIKKSFGITAHSFTNFWKWRGKLIVTTAGTGQYITSDEGNNWQEFIIPLNREILFINSQNRIFTEGSYSLAYSDDGFDWKIMNFPETILLSDGVLSEYNNIILLFDSKNNLNRTTDNGNTWKIVWSTNMYGGNKLISMISENEIYFSFDKSLYKSTDRGLSWNHLVTMDNAILTLSKSPWGNIYLGTSDNLYINSINGWKGLNPQVIVDDFIVEGWHINTVKKIVYTSNNQMFVLGEDLLISNDFGNKFSFLDKNIGKNLFYSYSTFEIADNGVLFFSQPYSSILKSTYNVTGNTFPNQTILYNNYPNPFNDQTTIEFYVGEPGNYILSIYDIIGQRIETNFQDKLNVGFYKINLRTKNLSSGIYFYRLQTPTFSETKKMILLK